VPYRWSGLRTTADHRVGTLDSRVIGLITNARRQDVLYNTVALQPHYRHATEMNFVAIPSQLAPRNSIDATTLCSLRRAIMASFPSFAMPCIALHCAFNSGNETNVDGRNLKDCSFVRSRISPQHTSRLLIT
jgi:hypothetical protein